MKIGPASIRDLRSLQKLERACFKEDAWSLFDLLMVLTSPEVVRLRAVENGEMVGFVAGETRHSRGCAWIATIGVDPRYQRRGIGRVLLRACEAKIGLPRVRLTVRMSNEGALALYQQEGYKTIDIWKGYYRDGEDGVVMEKQLGCNIAGI